MFRCLGGPVPDEAGKRLSQIVIRHFTSLIQVDLGEERRVEHSSNGIWHSAIRRRHVAHETDSAPDEIAAHVELLVQVHELTGDAEPVGLDLPQACSDLRPRKFTVSSEVEKSLFLLVELLKLLVDRMADRQSIRLVIGHRCRERLEGSFGVGGREVDGAVVLDERIFDSIQM